MKFSLLCLLFFSSFVAHGICPNESIDDDNLALVKNLNHNTISSVWDVMFHSPQQSAEVLVESLDVVEPIASIDVDINVWRLRALYALSGVRFRGRTSEDLDSKQRAFLLHDDGSVNYFGTWMSRDKTWIAPQDAQKEIITKWQVWVKSEAKAHRFICTDVITDYYFG